MNGIDKITQRIEEDAAQEIRRLDEETRAQAAEILRQARERAEKECAELLARGEKQAQAHQARLESAAQMESRKLRLAAKQQVLDEAFERALEQLCSLPDEDYIALLTRLVLAAVTTGKEQIAFSAKDRSRIGRQVVIAANDALVKDYVPELPEAVLQSKVGSFFEKMVSGTTAAITGTGLLTLAEEPRNIRGGFILINEKIEVNCAFETLVRLNRAKLELEVANLLFPDANSN